MALRLPRRALLATLPAAAAPRLAPDAADYQDHPRGGLSCAGCTFFRRPRSCQMVAGDISPNGWCKLFDLPD